MAQYDIYIAPLAENYQGTKLFTFYYVNPIGIRGLHSLIMRYLKVLFTPRGSNPADTSEGTNFGKLIGGNVSRKTDILDLITVFIEDASEQVKQQDRKSNRDASERLRSVSILSLTEVTLGFHLYIRLKNIEGTELDVTIPGLGPSA